MDGTDPASGHTRRRFLKAGTGVVGGTALAATATPGTAQMDAYGGYLSEEGTWEGVTADATGASDVTVAVGAAGNGGDFAFDPAALLVDPGTTITWEWTGRGGAHNVLNDVDDPLFRSGDPVDGEGETFEFTFEEEGVYQYVCVPHRALEMKGVVVVGEANAETELRDLGVGGEGLAMSAVWGGMATFGVVSLIGVAAYRELVGGEPR